MSDLISRSALLKKIAEEYDLNYGEILINPERFYEMVEEQPTAYDISKVVAELEEEKEISCADFTKYVNEYNPCLDDEYDDFFHKGLERAIVVIRKGGTE